MGKVLVAASIENMNDLYEVSQGRKASSDVRRIDVTDALIDTGAMFLSLPRRFVSDLGLQYYRTRRAKTSGGVAEFGMYGTARLKVNGRECIVEVAELPDECPVLIGQIPLEALDFIVDPVHGRLIGNPDHGGEHMMDLY